jgi:hypothetical protein
MAEKRNVKRPESNKEDSHLKAEEVDKTKKMSDVINLWGIAGRQEMMEMRRLWQLRIPRK